MSEPSAPPLAAMAEAVARMLAAAPSEWAGAAWAKPLAADPVAGAALARFLDPSMWLLGAETPSDPALERLLAMPSGGAQGPQARALRAALAEHRALVAGAYGRMAARVAQQALAEPPADLAAAQARWIAAAAVERDALQASDGYLASQAAIVAAAVALRQAEASATPDGWDRRGPPTRAEVDDLHRTVAELRRELRTLKRDLGRP